MSDQIVYLDSSAIVKRYVSEPGSEYVRNIYRNAYSGELRVSFSLWNVGEVLGVIDKARTLDRINDEEYLTIRKRFISETLRMHKLNVLVLVHLRVGILKQAWKIVERYHVYQADALQIASAKIVNASTFVVADKRLHEIALEEGLNSELI